MTSRSIDVTPQILNQHRIYGGSDNTNRAYTSSSRSLNYANGASISRPENEKVSTIPRVMNYKDAVGLFGAENHFVKVNVLIENPILGDYEVNTYEPAAFSEETVNPLDPYTLANVGDSPGQAFINYEVDIEVVNTYEPVNFAGNSIEGIANKYFKVELKNLKTGNIYIDSWLDIRLYNKFHEEHPYDIMYIKYNEPFYIGFHARNTKRLPYNVDCVIGQAEEGSPLPGFVEFKDIDPKLLSTKQ